MAKISKFLREQIRQERLLRDREAIRVLREHFTGYEAKEGYSLDVRKIAKMDRHRRYRARKKATKVLTLLAQPHDLVKPATPADAKALRAFTHERMRGMKHFIVQKPSKQSRVRVKAGTVKVSTKYPGQAVSTTAYFLFPRRASGPAHMLTMLEEMLPDMPLGMYEMLTDTYGGIGDIIERDFLRNELARMLEAYDRPKYGAHRFLNRVIGFRWMSTTLKGAEVQQAARDDRRVAQRNFNRKRRAQLAREAQARARRSLK